MDTWLETKVRLSFRFVQPCLGSVWEQIFTTDVFFYVEVLKCHWPAITDQFCTVMYFITIIFWKVRKRSFNIQSHLFHQLVISKQLLCELIIRNIDSAEITNRQTFMLKVSTLVPKGTISTQLCMKPTGQQLTTGTSFPKGMKHSISHK